MSWVKLPFWKCVDVFFWNWILIDDLIFGVCRHFQQYFSYIMATSVSGGRSRREPPTMTCHKHFPILSSFMTGFVTRVTRRVSLVEQELLTFPEHPSVPPVFSGVRATRSLVLCVQWAQLRWEMIVRFVDIGGIVNHHCLKKSLKTPKPLRGNQNP
jgi:hypothetical protein